ncbi:MAG: DegV family protein [Oscillospiraceae bacterium]|nr:DegV family protein [Oscillospiraceae bacterium]
MLSGYKVTCCSTADMPEEYFKKRDVPVALYHFELKGIEYPDDFGKTISFKDFYGAISAGAMPVTSQVNTDAFVGLFEPILADGLDIIHLTLSSGITGSVNSARLAREELLQRYPDRKLFVVDSLAASSGYGLLLDGALDLRDGGMEIDDLHIWLENNKLNLHHWFFTSDLRHLKRGGRVSSTSAVVGSLLNICPLLNVSNTGHLVARSKERGKKRVIAAMVDKMRRHARDGINYSGKCFISQSACLEDAQAVASLIKSSFQHLDGDVMINDVGAVIGAHTGPGTVALFFWGDRRID